MSNSIAQPDPSGADAIRVIRSLVEAQDLRAAKAQLRQLQSNTDDATWAMIVEIANTLRFKTHAVAVTKLRNLWRHNEQFRPIIEACVPKTNERQYIPEPQMRQFDAGPTAGDARSGRVSSRVEPDKRVEANQRTRSPSIKVIDDYEKALTKGERDDPGTERPELIVDRHDYDVEAITHVATTLCVACRLERAAIDRHTERVKAGLGDDGLCGECRSLHRPGLPELPAGHSLADQVHARLDFLAEHFHTEGRGIFRQEWRYADRHARPIISAWVKSHTSPEAEIVRRTSEVPDLNDWCEHCGEYRQLADHRKKLCFDCDPRHQQTVIPAGSVEARHNAYSREMSSAAGALASERSPRVTEKPTMGRKESAPQGLPGKQRNSTEKHPVADGPAAIREASAQNVRAKAAAAAQQRRRAITRRPDTMVKRSIR